MKIDQSYLDTLLAPLSDNALPTLSEYIKELEDLGITLDGPDGKIDRKFGTHLRHMSSNRLISNISGLSDLKSLGFSLGVGGHASINGSRIIMKVEHRDNVPHQRIHLGTISNDSVQAGTHNNQVTNLFLQDVVEKIAASNDLEAKSLLKSLLDNYTVGNILGTGSVALSDLL